MLKERSTEPDSQESNFVRRPGMGTGWGNSSEIQKRSVCKYKGREQRLGRISRLGVPGVCGVTGAEAGKGDGLDQGRSDLRG